MRKAQDDVMARGAAERMVADVLDRSPAAVDEQQSLDDAKAVVGHFKAAEFERGTSKDPDRNAVAMRRVVLTGPWEVDPDAVASK